MTGDDNSLLTRALLQAADFRLLLGDRVKAAQNYREVLEVDPTHAGAALRLAELGPEVQSPAATVTQTSKPRPQKMVHESTWSAKIVLVDWTLGNSCTYRCQYCPSECHDGSTDWLGYDKIVRFCDRLIDHYQRDGKRVQLNLTGGEVTLHPNLIELIAYVRARGARVSILSNASRGLPFWRRLQGKLDHINISFHPGVAKLDHFIAVANILARPGTSVHAVFMMPPRDFAASLRAAQIFAQQTRNITISLAAVRINLGAHLVAYSPAQLHTLEHERIDVVFDRPREQPARGRMRVIYADGSSAIHCAEDFVVRRENRWPGWRCNVGVDQLIVTKQGHVARAWCFIDDRFGNVSDENIEFPTAPVVCDGRTCLCPLDIMNERECIAALACMT